MMNANEIREITQNKQNKVAIEYIEQIVEPHIKVRAEYGYHDANFFFPKEPVEFEEVKTILENNGFDVVPYYTEFSMNDGYKVMW